MSHEHSDALKQLFPIELDGVFEPDIELEGQQLDTVEDRASDLLVEMFPDTTNELITCWERICGLNGEGKPMQTRRNAIVTQLRALGASSPQDFINLAARLGYTITINECQAPKAGIAKAGVAKVWDDEIIFLWQVTMTEQQLFDAKAGIAKAGNKIRWKETDTSLESILTALKPAHTQVTFYYS